MGKEQFKSTLKKLKTIHTIGIVTLAIGMAVSMSLPISAVHLPYWVKSVLITMAMANIPIIYNLYEKNVNKGTEKRTEEEQKENILKWGYIRMMIWMTVPLFCVAAYHFDSDTQTAGTFTSIFYLYAITFSFYAFVGRPGGWTNHQ
ncbi:MAG: hypothetical protein KBT32_01110 [Bacteroidales bacterium]|nr:hypothetical protein [Candidatus Physcocola equi]